jgi:transcriptional regulator with XRE-family HTH domain
MSKSSPSLRALPPDAQAALHSLGEQLALARLRRKETQAQWAERLGVSIPTLIRLERGDATVSMGVYATALWLLGLASGLAELADPGKDVRALEGDIRQAIRLRAARTRVAKSIPTESNAANARPASSGQRRETGGGE